MRTRVPRPEQRRAEEIDVVLMVPAEASRASWSTHALLVAEGYRVTVAHEREAMLRAVAANNAAIVFVPSSAYGRDAVAVRRALHPMESVAVPVVILGEGWETRVCNGSGDEPAVTVEERLLTPDGSTEEPASFDADSTLAGSGTR